MNAVLRNFSVTKLLSFVLAPAILYSVAAKSARAQTWEWDGSANGNWTTSANWTGPGGSPNGVNDVATLGSIITANTNIDIRNNRRIGTLNIQGAQDFTLFRGGGTRELRMDVSSGNAQINISGSNNSTIANSVRVELQDNLDLTHTGTGVFTIQGTISQTGSAKDINILGSGTTVFSGNNTYSGTTTINGGILQVENAGALGSTAQGTVVNSGGTLALSGGGTLSGESLQLAGTGQSGLGALRNVLGNNTFDGNISLSADATITSASSGQTLTIGADAANRTITNNGFDVTIDGAGDTFFNSQLVGSGGLIKEGTGTATLFYGNNSDSSLSAYSGPTTVNAGTLIADLGATDSTPLTPLTGPITIGGAGQSAELSTQWLNNIGDSTSVTVLDQGTLTINNTPYNQSGFTETIGNLNLAGGSLVRTIDGFSNDAVLQVSGDITHTGAETTSAVIQGNLDLNTSGLTTINVGDSSAATDLDIQASIGGTSSGVEKTGAGTLSFTGSQSNTYTGATTVNNGTLELAKSSGATAIAGTALTVNSGGTVMLGEANQINDAANLTLAGGTFSTGTGFSESLGTLTLTGNSSIDLGSAVHLLDFADSSAIPWTGSLTIYGWVGMPLTSGTAGQIFFGNNASTLTSSQLSMISFNGFGAGSILLSTGELVPVPIPELHVILAALLVLGLVLWREMPNLQRLAGRLRPILSRIPIIS